MTAEKEAEGPVEGEGTGGWRPHLSLLSAQGHPGQERGDASSGQGRLSGPLAASFQLRRFLRVFRDRRMFASGQAYSENGAHSECVREQQEVEGGGLRSAAIFLEETLVSLIHVTSSR